MDIVYAFNFESMDKDLTVIETTVNAHGATVHEAFEEAKKLFASENADLSWFSVWCRVGADVYTVL